MKRSEAVLEQMRQRLGLAAMLALLIPCGLWYIPGEEGALIVWTSIIGAIASRITFAGITFDFQLLSLPSNVFLFYWMFAFPMAAANIWCLYVLWTIGRRSRSSVLGGIAQSLVLYAMIVIFTVSVIPIPVVPLVVLLRTYMHFREKRTRTEEPLALPATEISLIRNMPRFYAHGLLFDLSGFVFTTAWILVQGLSMSIGAAIGSTTLILAGFIVFLVPMFVGVAGINISVARRVWHVEPDARITLRLVVHGIVMFFVPQFIVNPLSSIMNLDLGNMLFVAAIFLFRYTFVSYVEGVLGWILATRLHPSQPRPHVQAEDMGALEHGEDAGLPLVGGDSEEHVSDSEEENHDAIDESFHGTEDT